MSKPRMSRRDARRHAFHLVFQLPFYLSFYQQESVEILAESKARYYDFLSGETVEAFEGLSRPVKRDAEYIDRAVWGVFDRRAEIDEVIETFLRDWTIDRINKVDLALMRLSIYEMLCEPDVPLGAAVNEAVELAKEYGGDESPSFINGVLGNVSRQLALRQSPTTDIDNFNARHEAGNSEAIVHE